MLSEQISVTRFARRSSCAGVSACGLRSSVTPRTTRPPLELANAANPSASPSRWEAETRSS